MWQQVHLTCQISIMMVVSAVDHYFNFKVTALLLVLIWMKEYCAVIQLVNTSQVL